MIRIQRAGDRYPGGDPEAGVETRHALSFGPYYDPDNLRFGPLLAVNEERLAPGAGFDEHPHSHTEIVTWVVEGELTHRDTAGHETRVRPGDLQHLSAAAGVRHVERNAGDTPLTFVQMWLAPRETGGEPAYTLVPALPDTYALLAADATLHVHRPSPGDEVPLPDADTLYVHVVRGAVRLAGETLTAGDAARITAERPPAVEAAEAAELLVWAFRG
ncbi:MULTISPECIES: pirin family protein [Streptomyces]|uniref:Pirin family protein n=2 Tax=Streptomyces TaxID=1883 RepID=A0ABU4KK28_9ACTN|nr:pirin family protein [Streptomyces roseolus]MDX2297889.1 pirin family protein [Streptomyces roseolus]